MCEYRYKQNGNNSFMEQLLPLLAVIFSRLILFLELSLLSQ